MQKVILDGNAHPIIAEIAALDGFSKKTRKGGISMVFENEPIIFQSERAKSQEGVRPRKV